MIDQLLRIELLGAVLRARSRGGGGRKEREEEVQRYHCAGCSVCAMAVVCRPSVGLCLGKKENKIEKREFGRVVTKERKTSRGRDGRTARRHRTVSPRQNDPQILDPDWRLASLLACARASMDWSQLCGPATRLRPR